MARWGVLLFAILGLGALAGIEYGRSLLDPVSKREEIQIFSVKRGSSFGAVAAELEAAGLIRNARVAGLLARSQGIDQSLHAGEYELSPHLGTEVILATLSSGKVKTWPLTLPEGIRASEIATRIEAAGLGSAAEFLAAAQDSEFAADLGVESASLEGYLYPDTYLLPRGLSARDIARIMVRQFNQVWESQIAELASASTLSKDEIVILASIVEKETGAPQERPVIASVFLNRLGLGMRLETDPTVIYGIPNFDGNLKRRHLRDRSNPYNTYKIPALPPGAIANPGANALLAVVKPEPSEYLYFVSRNDGTHHFSVEYREHVNAVNRYQKRRRR